MAIQIIARAIARRVAAFPPERRQYILGPAITSAVVRHCGATVAQAGGEMVDFIDALTMAVFDELENLERGSGL